MVLIVQLKIFLSNLVKVLAAFLKLLWKIQNLSPMGTGIRCGEYLAPIGAVFLAQSHAHKCAFV